MEVLILYGCNSGYIDYVEMNPASECSRRIYSAPVLASDGTVGTEKLYLNLSKRSYTSLADNNFEYYLPVRVERDNYGWVVYQNFGNNVEFSEGLGKEFNITTMLDEINNSVCSD